MQDLKERMNTILKDPTLPPDVKIKEYGLLLNRFLTLQQQQLIPNSHITVSGQAPNSNLSKVIEQSQPSIEATPQRTIPSRSGLSSDSGFASATPKLKEPSLLQRLTSKVRTPFKATISPNQREEEMAPTSSASTPISHTTNTSNRQRKTAKIPQVETLSRG